MTMIKKFSWVLIFLLFATPCSGAELLVKVGNRGGFKDGDIIHAWNDKRIKKVFAQHICHVENTILNEDGLRNPNSLLEDYLKNTSKYKFERISKAEIRRTNLITLDQEVLSEKPNVSGEYIWVQEYIDYALKHPRHKIFGTKGNEYWYGGNRDTEVQIDKVWDAIESKTPNNRIDKTVFPYSDNTLSKYYAITVDDFTDATGGDLTKNVANGERKYKVDYKNLNGLSVSDVQDIEDSKKKIDHRKSKSFTRSNIVQIK